MKGFTGIDSPYDRPENPELVIKTVHGDGNNVRNVPVSDCVQKILDMLADKGVIDKRLAEEAQAWFKVSCKAYEKETPPNHFP